MKDIAQRNYSEPFVGMRVLTMEDLFRDDVKPGTFTVREHSIAFECPCGCGQLCDLPFNNQADTGHPAWGWDGDSDKPTLTPSIRDVGTCCFHGYLTAGIWSFCADSGQGATR